MKIQRSLDNLHPIMAECVRKIQRDVIDAHNIPIRLFETGREHDRHEMLVSKGKTKDIISHHLYNLKNDPPLYATAVDYVYFDSKWSWNLRDATTNSWYILFGNLVLDACPELQWSGMNRKSVNYCHFEIKRRVLLEAMKDVPCVI
ncbi:MAG: M15 family metallopeptidase [Deltaproteobacteria bacterium]|nr:M15 family metallopeptidase [Deltaproteobacteria bacterium]